MYKYYDINIYKWYAYTRTCIIYPIYKCYVCIYARREIYDIFIFLLKLNRKFLHKISSYLFFNNRICNWFKHKRKIKNSIRLCFILQETKFHPTRNVLIQKSVHGIYDTEVRAWYLQVGYFGTR